MNHQKLGGRQSSPSPSQTAPQNYFINQINISHIASRLPTSDHKNSVKLKRMNRNGSLSGSFDVGFTKHIVNHDKGKQSSNRFQSRNKAVGLSSSGIGWFNSQLLSSNNSFVKKPQLKVGMPNRQSSKKIDAKKMCDIIGKVTYVKPKADLRLESTTKLGLKSQSLNYRFSLTKPLPQTRLSNMLTSFKQAARDAIKRPQSLHKRHASFDASSIGLKKSSRDDNTRQRKSARNKSVEISCEYLIAKPGISWPKVSFGVRTKKGKCEVNRDKTNQDSFVANLHFMGSKSTHLFGVYDGHGENGHLVSCFIASNLPYYLRSQNSSDQPFTAQSLHSGYEKVFEMLYKSGIDISYSGSTAVTSLISGTVVLTANTGDSRAVVAYLDKFGKIAYQSLSNDHKPDLKEEAKRILKSGGRIEPYKQPTGKFYGPHRVWLAQEDVPGLAMSRAVGDLVACSVGVTWKPEISEYRLTEADKFLLIGSDGLWEHISTKKVVAAVWQYYKQQDLEGACDEVMRLALKSWKQSKQTDIDDITFVLVFID